ncbi:MAG: acetyl-CoA C-acyltransferase, partial [archaeon]|nr:acetyl-CoA C-acyltransferase [archaeon]
MIGKEVYMVDYVRTPFSRARPRTPPRDAFSDIPGVELAAETLINMFDVRLKDKVEKKEVGEYIFGCGMPIGENFLASGKLALWLAKFPNEIPAFATERQCGSGMTALHHGVMDIAMGYCDTVLITGMESQTREPMHNNKNLSFNTKVVDPRSRWYNGDLDIITGMVMIQTAQKLWEEESDHFSKEDMDKIGARSHRLAAEAQEAGFFKDEIVPIMAHE